MIAWRAAVLMWGHKCFAISLVFGMFSACSNSSRACTGDTSFMFFSIPILLFIVSEGVWLDTDDAVQWRLDFAGLVRVVMEYGRIASYAGADVLDAVSVTVIGFRLFLEPLDDDIGKNLRVVIEGVFLPCVVVDKPASEAVQPGICDFPGRPSDRSQACRHRPFFPGKAECEVNDMRQGVKRAGDIQNLVRRKHGVQHWQLYWDFTPFLYILSCF